MLRWDWIPGEMMRILESGYYAIPCNVIVTLDFSRNDRDVRIGAVWSSIRWCRGTGSSAETTRMYGWRYYELLWRHWVSVEMMRMFDQDCYGMMWWDRVSVKKKRMFGQGRVVWNTIGRCGDVGFSWKNDTTVGENTTTGLCWYQTINRPYTSKEVPI